MADDSSFFSDLKILLSLLALAISLISLIWTLSNQFEQNQRWDKLNAANIPTYRSVSPPTEVAN